MNIRQAIEKQLCEIDSAAMNYAAETVVIPGMDIPGMELESITNGGTISEGSISSLPGWADPEGIEAEISPLESVAFDFKFGALSVIIGICTELGFDELKSEAESARKKMGE